MKLNTKQRKVFRIRNKLKKVSEKGRFRLSVSRSAKNISAQIIDDSKNVTVLSASSKDKSIKSLNKKNKTELSQFVAENLAKKAGVLSTCNQFHLKRQLSVYDELLPSMGLWLEAVSVAF